MPRETSSASASPCSATAPGSAQSSRRRAGTWRARDRRQRDGPGLRVVAERERTRESRGGQHGAARQHHRRRRRVPQDACEPGRSQCAGQYAEEQHAERDDRFAVSLSQPASTTSGAHCGRGSARLAAAGMPRKTYGFQSVRSWHGREALTREFRVRPVVRRIADHEDAPGKVRSEQASQSRMIEPATAQVSRTERAFRSEARGVSPLAAGLRPDGLDARAALRVVPPGFMRAVAHVIGRKSRFFGCGLHQPDRGGSGPRICPPSGS
jgi:hypothetical protein